jgi:SAM-dependent methyltransferase
MDPSNRRDRRAAAVQARRRDVAGPARPPSLAAARALERRRQLRDAFDAYLQLIAATPTDADAQSAFGHFLVANTPARPHPDVEAALRAALDGAWVRPDLLAQPVARYLDAKWPGAVAAPLASEPALLAHPVIAGLLRDPLLLSLLRATPAATPSLDIFLARARHAALASAASNGPIDALLPLLAALGERAMSSGFALTLPALASDQPCRDAEPVQLATLRATASTPAAVALLAAFEPLDARTAAIAEAAGLAGLVAAQVAQPRVLALIARELTPATPFEAETRLVTDQYETHPYPQWVREPAGTRVPVPAEVQTHLKRTRRFPPRDVLVAGCGTGQHALTAADRWPGAQLLAIDGSRASLAYAILKTRERRLDRIRFALADLLRVDALETQFDVIEAVGVLHHLADPAQGLGALARTLKPGGAMLIGLYARAARQSLTAARALAGPTHPRSDFELRAYRAQALAGGVAPEILYSPDFYSLGGVRDLIFHEREHSFDLAQVAALVTGAGLRLLTIDTPAAARGLATVPRPTDVAGWQALEAAQPLLFGNMYEVWAGAAG